jgi:hypothetical protein
MAQEIKGADWLIQLEGATLTTAAASDAENITGTATDVACTPASMMAALAALAFPIAMTKVAQFTIGTLSSANDTSGVKLSAAKTFASRVCADTGGAALAASFTRAAAARYLIGTAITSGADISTAGFEGLLKSIVSVNVGGNQGGLMGHYETAGTLTLTGSINTTKSGVTSFIDIATGGTVAANTVVSAYGVQPANFGTLTGRASIIHVTNPIAGTWSSFLDLSTATGLTQAEAAGSTADKFLKVYVNGVLYTIAMATA